MERIDNIGTSFWEFKGTGEYSDKKFLMHSPFPIAFILISYLWFVLRFGPKYMKNRKSFNLQNCLLVYNAVQVLVSMAIFGNGTYYLLQYGLWHSTCYCEKDGIMQKLLDGSHYYFLTKLVELLDTVFFVLRKKQNQVSFLHVYHHTLMVIATWSIVKYSRTDNTVFLGTINSLVHVVMYGYYGLSVFPQLAKYLWWKKYITQMQLVQFILMFTHCIVSHMVSECRPAYFLLASVSSNTVLFLFLFGDFYVKSYINKFKNRNIVSAGKASSLAQEKQYCYRTNNNIVSAAKALKLAQE